MSPPLEEEVTVRTRQWVAAGVPPVRCREAGRRGANSGRGVPPVVDYDCVMA